MSFLREYETFTDGNEAPRLYHLWCSLVALSSLVSRKVWVEMGYFRVYANMYVVLDGPPGARKTTAMSQCKSLLRAVEDVPLSAECQTKESLVKELAGYKRYFALGQNQSPVEYAPITICVTELSQFIGAASAHMIDFLTTIYDETRYANKTKNKGSEDIVGPYVVLLGCTTPAWITARLRDDVISGGFSRRAVFVYWSGERAKIPRPIVTDAQRVAWDRVVEEAKRIQGLKGVFTWEPDAALWYDDWYINKHKIPKDPTIAGYFESKHIQLVKIAMLVSASEGNSMTLSKVHLELALDILETNEVNMPQVFAGIGRNELNAIASQIMQLLQGEGTMVSEKEIYKTMHREADSSELFKVLTHLVATEQLIKLPRHEGGLTKYFFTTKENYEHAKRNAAVIAASQAPASIIRASQSAQLGGTEHGSGLATVETQSHNATQQPYFDSDQLQPGGNALANGSGAKGESGNASA